MVVDCRTGRRFGVELEVNTRDGIVIKSNPPLFEPAESPLGADDVALIINKVLRKPVKLICWGHISNNTEWLVKPDSSCGIEVNSPILKGREGLEEAATVADGLKMYYNKVDDRCGLHVHINIADLTPTQLTNVLGHYIKSEHLFFDSVPSYRKNNRYCQLIGMSDLFCDDFNVSVTSILNKMQGIKYYSCNIYHFMEGGGFSSTNNRKLTMEFRIAEEQACVDSTILKNWIRLLLYFVDATKDVPLKPYVEGDSSTGLLWVDLSDFIKLLRWNEPLSPDLAETKCWFLDRMLKYGYDSKLKGVWSNEGRQYAREELLKHYRG